MYNEKIRQSQHSSEETIPNFCNKKDNILWKQKVKIFSDEPNSRMQEFCQIMGIDLC